MEQEIKDQVDRISKSDWISLVSFIPEIERSKGFGSFEEGKEIAENFRFNYSFNQSSIVGKFIDLVYEKQIIFSFDWMEWKEGEAILNNKNTNFMELDLYTLNKLIIAIVRNDKFSDGYLIRMFDEGVILKILYSIKSIILEEEIESKNEIRLDDNQKNRFTYDSDLGLKVIKE